MKLRQTEYCHNCNQQVVFEFEDTIMKQIINCPNCGHEHYRELDESTILNIRIQPGQRSIRIAEIPIAEFTSQDVTDIFKIPPIKYEEREIMGESNGQAIVKPKEGEKKQKTVSKRRWGTDPIQRG